MDYVRLGRSDLKVSRVCLGTMTWGQQNTEADGHAQMDYALSRGVNFWDTAEMYSFPVSEKTVGRSEEIIGSWFEASGRRDDVILATKLQGRGYTYLRGGRERIDGANVREAVDASLKRMKTDYIDVYQMHWPDRNVPMFGQNHAGMVDFHSTTTEQEVEDFLDTLGALDECVKAGKIRHAGLSNETAWGTMKYLELAGKHDFPRMVSLQNEFSLLDRKDDAFVAEMCVREDVGYLPWSPLAMSVLSGKYRGGAVPKGSRIDYVGAKNFSRNTEMSQLAVEGYYQVAQKHGLDMTQMALAFVYQQKFVTSTIIGATSLEQLACNMDAYALKLSDEVMADIDAVYRCYPIPY